MQNKTLIVLSGTYGSGKTTFAKHYSACHSDTAYLDVDVLSGLDNKVFEYGVFLGRLRALINNTRYGKYILDGAPDTVALSNALKRDLACQVKYWMCYASPDVIRERQRRKQHVNGLPHSIARIEMLGYNIAAMVAANDKEASFIDTGCSEFYSWRSLSEWITHWQGLCLLSRFPRDYQDVALRSVERVGHSESFKTWERLISIYDFKGKSVIDYGTNLGYFLFKAEDAGAVELLGVDKGNFKVAHGTAMIRGSKAVFQSADLKSFKPGKMYDCALCLNVLHHISSTAQQLAILFKIFTHAKDVLFETPEDRCVTIDNVAMVRDFHLVCRINSHRDGRVIMLYSSHQEAFTPVKYAYTWKYYQQQRLRKYILHNYAALASKARWPVRMIDKILRLLGLYRPVYRLLVGKR